MELVVAKKDLLRLVTRMQNVAERKSTMPVLSNVLLTVDGANALRLSATDLYLAISGRIAAEVTSGGSVAVSAKDLFERVKMMPEGPIVISTQESSLTTLKASGSARRYTLRGAPGDEFPPLPVPSDGSPTLALDVDVLQSLIERTHFSISPDESRPHLNSALFEWEGDVVRMVTTDGHRLSKMEIHVSGRQASATMLIPHKAVQELRRLCDDALVEHGRDGAKDKKAQLQITQSGSNAFFQSGATTFSVKLVDAQFPPYAQVIPKTSEKRLRAPRLALAEALRAIAIAASERTGGVKVSLGTNTLRITSESPESGDGFDELPIEYTGPAITLGFNAKYVLDVLSALQEEEVDIGLSGELDPAVVRPVSDVQFLGVVMPMRI